MPQVCIYFIVSFCIRKQLLICYRKLLSSSLLAVETYFKGAIQGYVVTILIRVIDKVQKSKVFQTDCLSNSIENCCGFVHLVKIDEGTYVHLNQNGKEGFCPICFMSGCPKYLLPNFNVHVKLLNSSMTFLAHY